MRIPRGTTGLVGGYGWVQAGQLIADEDELAMVEALQRRIDAAPPIHILEPGVLDELGDQRRT